MWFLLLIEIDINTYLKSSHPDSSTQSWNISYLWNTALAVRNRMVHAVFVVCNGHNSLKLLHLCSCRHSRRALRRTLRVTRASSEVNRKLCSAKKASYICTRDSLRIRLSTTFGRPAARARAHTHAQTHNIRTHANIYIPHRDRGNVTFSCGKNLISKHCNCPAARNRTQHALYSMHVSTSHRPEY